MQLYEEKVALPALTISRIVSSSVTWAISPRATS